MATKSVRLLVRSLVGPLAFATATILIITTLRAIPITDPLAHDPDKAGNTTTTGSSSDLTGVKYLTNDDAGAARTNIESITPQSYPGAPLPSGQHNVDVLHSQSDAALKNQSEVSGEANFLHRTLAKVGLGVVLLSTVVGTWQWHRRRKRGH